MSPNYIHHFVYNSYWFTPQKFHFQPSNSKFIYSGFSKFATVLFYFCAFGLQHLASIPAHSTWNAAGDIIAFVLKLGFSAVSQWLACDVLGGKISGAGIAPSIIAVAARGAVTNRLVVLSARGEAFSLCGWLKSIRADSQMNIRSAMNVAYRRCAEKNETAPIFNAR